MPFNSSCFPHLSLFSFLEGLKVSWVSFAFIFFEEDVGSFFPHYLMYSEQTFFVVAGNFVLFPAFCDLRCSFLPCDIF